MKKNQSLSSELVIQVWKEMLKAYEEAAPPPYPSVRTVAEELAARGYRTYKNVPPSREAVRVAMKKTEEGQALIDLASTRHKEGGLYS